MPITVECPGCLKRYDVSPKAIGKKVKCACGETFIAKDSMQGLESSFEAIGGMEIPDSPPFVSQSMTETAEYTAVGAQNSWRRSRLNFNLCHFALIGRMLVYAGMFLILLGLLVAVPEKRRTPGSFPPNGNETFTSMAANAGLAFDKIVAIVAGTAMAICGCCMWSGSDRKPHKIDSSAIAVFLIFVLFLILKQFVRDLFAATSPQA